MNEKICPRGWRMSKISQSRGAAAAAALALAVCLCFGTAAFAVEGTAASNGVVDGSSPRKPDSELAKLVEGLQKGNVTDDRIKALPGPLAGDVLSYFANLNQADIVKRLTGLGVPADQSNSFGTNALIIAIGGDSLDAASALLAGGADPQAATSRGTPATYANKVGSVEMKTLLGGKVLGPSDRLRSSARKGELETLRSLVASGADPGSADDKGVTPILEATQSGDLEAVRLLLKLGAKAEGSPNADFTPLAVAVVSGNVEMERTLLDANADPNVKIRGVPILTLAVIAGNEEVTNLLLAAKADVGIKGDDGTKPADVAAAIGQLDLAVRLGGATAFSPAIDLFAAIKAKDENKVRAALSAGADPNQKNAEGYPALVYAAAFGNRSSVDVLMAADADPFAVGPGGVSALHAAYARKDDALSDSAADAVITWANKSTLLLLNVKDGNGRSAAVVMAAHAKSKPASNPYLHALGIDPAGVRYLANEPDGDGITPLVAAVLADNGVVLKGLIDAGTTLGKAKEDVSLQELARARGSWSALQALPSDRVIPDGLAKGASSSVKSEFQSLLSQWGYYKGKVDGSFGKMSRAAAVAFFKDRREEIRKIATASGRPLSSFEFPNGKPGDTKLRIVFHGRGESCTWKVVEWYPKGTNDSVGFVGCVKGDQEWNSNGVGYSIFGDGSDTIQLFGEEGWDGAVDLK
ncbi:ankyrin repeat domain-containing protein [Mesorhizobium sp. M0048]|uniref:ankyrin repeat domain-containing protein n=1 Tax=Mesorhizobium sp. M0048 TaxID=2956860 RepID=UPI00333E025C